MAIVRTLAFPLREMGSQWKVFSSESHLYFKWVLQTAEQTVDCLGEDVNRDPRGGSCGKQEMGGGLGPPATGSSSEIDDSGHILALFRK